MKKNFTLTWKGVICTLFLMMTSLPTFAEGAGTYHFKPTTFAEGETSPHGITYAKEFDLTLCPYTGENPNGYTYKIYGWCGIPTAVAYGKEDADGVITVGLMGAYTSAYEGYSGIGTESLGSAEGTIMGNIVLTPDGNGGYTVSDFTAVNTVLSDGLKNTVLATYQGGMTAVKKYYRFYTTTFTKGEDSPHGITYEKEFNLGLYPFLGENPNDYSYVISGWCGIPTAVAYGKEDANGVITVGLMGAYTSAYEGYSGIGTESLGSAEGTIMGNIVLTPDGNGGYTVSDFTAVNTVLSDGLKNTVLATYQGGLVAPCMTFHYAPETFTEGEASPHGITYAKEFDLMLCPYLGENPNGYAYKIYGWCGIPTAVAYGKEDADGVITVGLMGAYTSAYEGYSGIGTESLGSAEGTIMGNIVLTPDGNGGYAVSDFTAVNTVLSDGLVNTVLATYQGGSATSSDGVVTSINEVQKDKNIGGIISPDDICEVYGLDGLAVFTGRAKDVNALKKGLYIVKSGNVVYKVMVK